MKIRILFVVWTVVALASPASAEFVTGNELVSLWQAHQRVERREQQREDFQDGSTLMGYVQGVFDALEDTELSAVPSHMTVKQLVTIIGRYLDAHPEQWHLSGALIVKKALLEAFVKP